MTQPRQGALAAITAALSSKPNTAETSPVQGAFTFVPQGGGGGSSSGGMSTHTATPLPASNPFAPAPQPTLVQAAAAFVATVPRAAEQHGHPQTGVPFAPINPPGEASSAPTVGLDAAPVQAGMPTLASVAELVGPFVQPAAPSGPVDPTPKARARKPRAGEKNAGGMPGLVAIAQPVGDGAVESAEASVAPSNDEGRAPTADTNLRACLETLQVCLPEGCTLTINGK